jgi:hypothetical protein
MMEQGKRPKTRETFRNRPQRSCAVAAFTAKEEGWRLGEDDVGVANRGAPVIEIQNDWGSLRCSDTAEGKGWKADRSTRAQVSLTQGAGSGATIRTIQADSGSTCEATGRSPRALPKVDKPSASLFAPFGTMEGSSLRKRFRIWKSQFSFERSESRIGAKGIEFWLHRHEYQPIRPVRKSRL